MGAVDPKKNQQIQDFSPSYSRLSSLISEILLCVIRRKMEGMPTRPEKAGVGALIPSFGTSPEPIRLSALPRDSIHHG